MASPALNALYRADNLDVLRKSITDASVDLAYLDPPFKTNKHYAARFKRQPGQWPDGPVAAYADTWRWNDEAAAAFEDTLAHGPHEVRRTLSAFRDMLGPGDMLAYLAMIAVRLVELKRVLRPAGSVYLHCDQSASHPLKLLMDSVFGPANFQNEIVWAYRTGGVGKRRWARKHDVLLFYSRTPRFTFNPQRERVYYEKPFFSSAREDAGRHYADVYMRDVWDIPAVINVASERLGYPTQKPEALLSRIVQASGSEGGVVLDPFCGCGTTLVVAERLGRRWIGIDSAYLATALTKQRLREHSGLLPGRDYALHGEPQTMAEASRLQAADPRQFRHFVLGLLGARPVEARSAAGDGFHGRMLWAMEGEPAKPQPALVAIADGKEPAKQLKELARVLRREGVSVGVLVSVAPLLAAAEELRAAQGKAGGKRQVHLQVLTLADLLAAQHGVQLAGASG